MPSLLIVGNIREETFANAILAADTRVRDLGGEGLTDVFVLHSQESERFLTERTNWRDHLAQFGVSRDIFVNAVVNLESGGGQQLNAIARHVERFLLALDQREDVYIDLTNGTSQYKSLLGAIAFVLGVRRQFVLNTHGPVGFLDPDALRAAYVELPDPALLDRLAPVWLTEVRRFNVQSRTIAKGLADLGTSSESEIDGFQADIRNAVYDWFRGEKQGDGSALGGAVRHIGRAFEDMIRVVYARIFPERAARAKTPHEMLAHIKGHLARVTGEYDPELFEDVSQLLRRLRNASIHGQHAADFGRIRARLATELLFATAELFSILHGRGLLSPDTRPWPNEPTAQLGLEGKPGESYYFGVDGDDTGRELERLFQGDSEQEAFSRFSESIDKAMKSVAKSVRKPPISGEVLFCSGDDLLFRGRYNAAAIDGLRTLYSRVSGQTCCIGFGRTPKDAYVALKIAKASPGKDATMGVEIVRLEESARSSSIIRATPTDSDAEESGVR